MKTRYLSVFFFVISLSGVWQKERVSLDHSLSLAPRTKKTIRKLEKESRGRYLPEYSTAKWKGHYIPGPENPPPDRYQGGAWYRRTFYIPEDLQDKVFILRFEAVNYTADVWINGKWAGYHEGGYTPFSVNITPYVKKGEKNILAVRTDNIPWEPLYAGRDIVPYKTCDWWNYGGITRGVYIETRKKIYIKKVVIRRKNIRIFFNTETGSSLPLTIKIWATKITEENITDTSPTAIIDGEKPIFSRTEKVEIKNPLSVPMPLKSPALWSPAHPNLYVLELSLGNGERYTSQFGIRDIGVKAGRLFLNDKLIYLNGTARHEVPGQSIKDIYNDLKTIKRMNVNFLRTAHYPNRKELYILTDRMGILVWEEIPVYWFGKTGFEEQSKRKTADSMWMSMIGRDINRPSIIFWGTCNECGTQKERKQYIKRLYNLAYSADGTRLVAQSAAGSDPLDATHSVCDVIGATMYYGIFYGKDPYKDTSNALRIMHSAFPDKPVIVTEYGTWSGVSMSLAEKQTETAKKNLAAFFEKPYVCGWVWWCAFDWYSMISTFQTMGAVTIKRDYIKPVYYYLQKEYGKRISPLEAEILQPYNYETVRGIIDIKTKVRSPYKITKATLMPGRWDTTALPDGPHILVLEAQDETGVIQTSAKKVFIDNIDDPPDIKINIKNGARLMHRKKIDIALSDDRTPPADIKAQFFIDGEKKDPEGYIWNLDGYADRSRHTVTVKAEDAAGNISKKTAVVTVDNSPGEYIRLPFNHDWISFDANMSDGTGWDFPAEELPESGKDFFCGDIKFMFGDKKDGKMNNTECRGQKIDIKPAQYKQLYILCTSHDGAVTAAITPLYGKDTEAPVSVSVSDWWGAVPMFGETTALKCTHHHERNGRDNPPGAGIYMIKLKLRPEEKLTGILLPDEPRLHIFAMTLDPVEKD